MSSMSPPSVESRSAPCTVRYRWIGTATDTIISLCLFWRTTALGAPVSARVTSG
jgi:hypothetical protein